jgi:hypothetical protein
VKISELVTELEALWAEHGDVDVCTYDDNKGYLDPIPEFNPSGWVDL